MYIHHYLHIEKCNVSIDVYFPGGSDGKECVCNARDPGSVPGSGRSPGEGNGNPLQYSCLENPMDRGPGRLQSIGLQRVRNKWACTGPWARKSENTSRSVVSNSFVSPWTIAHQVLCPWDSPGKNTGEGSHSLLQRILPTQESNPALLHCRQILLYYLSHKESPGWSGRESLSVHNGSVPLGSLCWCFREKTSLHSFQPIGWIV